MSFTLCDVSFTLYDLCVLYYELCRLRYDLCHVHYTTCVAAPIEYADWFEQVAPDDMTLGALQLHTSVEQQANDAR